MSGAAVTSAVGAEVYVGRQPIYDRRRRVSGYELLFRPTAGATASPLANDQATAAVIVNTFTEFGLSELSGGRLAFLNLPREFVDGRYALPFGPEGVVLELLETVPDEPATRAGVARLAAAGYALALDDFRIESPSAGFLEHASFVKVDVQDASAEEFAAIVRLCEAKGVQVIAERVETEAQVHLAAGLGVELFQGWFFAKAETLRADALKVSGVTAMRLHALLADPDVDLAEVEAAVRIDLALTYRILRVVNSASTGLSRRVSAVSEALALMGLDQLRVWILMFMLGDMCGGSENVLARALTRARACELMAPDAGCVPTEAFTVGLLSYLEELLRRPMREVLDDLPLQPHLNAALLYGDGPLGLLLAACRTYERRAYGDAPDVVAVEGVTDHSVEAMARSYLASMGWSLRTCRELLDPAPSESITYT